MNLVPKHESSDPDTTLVAEVLTATVEDAQRIGQRRARRLAEGRDIPQKAHKTWKVVRQLTLYVHTCVFREWVQALGLDDALIRKEILRIMSGVDLVPTRKCPKCHHELPTTCFGVRKINGKLYKQSWCKSCRGRI